MSTWRWEWALLAGGLGLAGIPAAGLHENGGLKPSQNPFAVQRSGYGMVLARLAQDSVNNAWHSGLEGDGVCEHEHEHDGACAHHGDSGDGDAGGPPAGLLSVAGMPPRSHARERKTIVGQGIEGLLELKHAKLHRTNPFGLTNAHRNKVAADIETILLRSYRMDPSDYGVYNAYLLFLTASDLRARPGTLEQAKQVAGWSVAAAREERESPFPWLTAASALLDEFLLDQQRARELGVELPRAVISDYGIQMNACLARVRELQSQAEAEHRWKAVGAERAASAMERLHFLERAAQQFAALAARAER